MDQTAPVFSSEYALNSPKQQAFWQTIIQGTLTAADGVTLAYMTATHPQARGSIVISNGRVESYLKYQELVFDLYNQGYSIFAIDHRGQGLSSRLTANPHQGHVQQFSDYVDDFTLFMESIVLGQATTPLFLLGHSMGGAIGTLYLKQQPRTFTAAAFSAPMYGIKLPLAKEFIRWLAGKLDTSQYGKEPNYVLNGHNYRPGPFKANELTHSESRYLAYRALYKARPELQLGSPTNRWLTEAITGADTCIDAATHSHTPILILQAGNDRIVDNAAQKLAQSPNCQLKVIKGAAHEIFIEQDNYRNQALNHILAFFERHIS